jgi:hypothetical protein
MKIMGIVTIYLLTVIINEMLMGERVKKFKEEEEGRPLLISSLI